MSKKVDLSGYEVLVRIMFEMDGIPGEQAFSFAIAAGQTDMPLRNRVLFTAGAAFESHMRQLADELDIELERYAYRIHGVDGVWFRESGEGTWFPVGDSALDWMTLECIVFGTTSKLAWYTEETV
jgi:hypothetical protein